jgi:hypothetical protein
VHPGPAQSVQQIGEFTRPVPLTRAPTFPPAIVCSHAHTCACRHQVDEEVDDQPLPDVEALVGANVA